MHLLEGKYKWNSSNTFYPKLNQQSTSFTFMLCYIPANVHFFQALNKLYCYAAQTQRTLHILHMICSWLNVTFTSPSAPDVWVTFHTRSLLPVLLTVSTFLHLPESTADRTFFEAAWCAQDSSSFSRPAGWLTVSWGSHWFYIYEAIAFICIVNFNIMVILL